MVGISEEYRDGRAFRIPTPASCCFFAAVYCLLITAQSSLF